MGKHIYSENLKFGAYYTYDKNNNKVYDLKSMRQDFKELIKKLKKYRASAVGFNVNSNLRIEFSRCPSIVYYLQRESKIPLFFVQKIVNIIKFYYLTRTDFVLYICGIN